MKWKRSARKIPSKYLRAKVEEHAAEHPVPQYRPGEGHWRKPNPFAATPAMVTRHGKPFCERTHIVDAIGIDTDDDGNEYKSVVGQLKIKAGHYVFPKGYVHPGKRIVGKTVDVRWTGERWEIYLDAVLRNPDGSAVLFDGMEIDASGWFAESALVDAGFGPTMIKPGATVDIEAEQQARIERRRCA